MTRSVKKAMRLVFFLQRRVESFSELRSCVGVWVNFLRAAVIVQAPSGAGCWFRLDVLECIYIRSLHTRCIFGIVVVAEIFVMFALLFCRRSKVRLSSRCLRRVSFWGGWVPGMLKMGSSTPLVFACFNRVHCLDSEANGP